MLFATSTATQLVYNLGTPTTDVMSTIFPYIQLIFGIIVAFYIGAKIISFFKELYTGK
jgi:hypothetical protein